MYEDDEEIYDDTGADNQDEDTMNTANKPVSALLSRFENNAADTPTKPAITPKPGLKPKYGAALGSSPGGEIGTSYLKPKPAADKPNVEEKSSPGGWPPKKREPPAVFRGGADTEDKPQLAVKPVPKWQQKNDIKTDSKNDTNNNTNTTKVNGVSSSPVGKKVPGKLDLSAKFGNLNIPVPKQIGATGPGSSPSAVTGPGSPRNKPGESANIPKPDDKSTEKPPLTPKNKPFTTPGSAPGVNVLKSVTGTTNGPINFRAQLKPAAERRASHDTSHHNDSDVQLRSNVSKFGPRVSLKRVSITTVVRTSDGKKFQKTNKKSLDDSAKPPDKPSKVDFDLDLEMLAYDYKFAMEELDAADKESHGFTEFEEEEFYDDCGNLTETRKKSRVVSLIPAMTEEEEWEENGFTGLQEDLPPPPEELLQEEYDDVGVATGAIDEDDGELYEALSENEDEAPPPPGPKPSSQPTAAPVPPLPPVTGDKPNSEKPKDTKDAKELEKERKRKEKEEKELLKKKEKELKKLTKLLKVTPEVLTQTVGQGKVKTNAKGKEKSGELALNAGEEVDIIRMVDNPRGKWLIRLHSTEKDPDKGPLSPLELIGYCDENNIEYMKSSAPEKKTSVSSTTPIAEEVQETYEDVDGENTGELIEDEIYEECN